MHSDETPSTSEHRADELPPEAFDHPRGTLAIVLLYGVLFGLGWWALYAVEFLGRGATHP